MVNGNQLSFNAISELHWSAEYFYVGGRLPLYSADTCNVAQAMAETQTGSYWGRLADWGYNNTLSPTDCTGYTTNGADGIVRFDLPAKTSLSVTHDLQTDDSALYLLDDCNNEDSCISGSDVSIGFGPETVFYFNASDVVKSVYAVLDGYQTSAGIFYADVVVNTMLEPEMYDTCTGVLTQAVPTGANGYYTDNISYTGQLDPSIGGCIATSSPGNDAMTKITLQDQETLTVLVSMPGENPAIYLLYNCTSTNACAAGADFDFGPNEQMAYTNTSGDTETLYLVIDSKTALQPWFMTIDIL
jgi:hypothetical protein